MPRHPWLVCTLLVTLQCHALKVFRLRGRVLRVRVGVDPHPSHASAIFRLRLEPFDSRRGQWPQCPPVRVHFGANMAECSGGVRREGQLGNQRRPDFRLGVILLLVDLCPMYSGSFPVVRKCKGCDAGLQWHNIDNVTNINNVNNNINHINNISNNNITNIDKL